MTSGTTTAGDYGSATIDPALPSHGARLLHSARRFGEDRVLVCALSVFGLLALVSALGPFFTSSPDAYHLTATLQAPSPTHLMGTDNLGRDIFARVVEGGRISLLVAAAVTLIGATLGSLLGVVSGALGGWLDGLLMRPMDAVLAFPPLVLAMAVTVGLGVGLTTATLGIAITSIPWFARLIRSEALLLRSLPYVEAAVALGESRRRIIVRHILPHLIPVLAIQAAGVFGYAILSLAALGFVGLGAQVPTPEWGTMITQGEPYALTGQWWVSLFPGLALLVVVSVTSIVADRIRDILDPRGQYVGV
jgi:peptide/nickel transport system permease protein